MLMHEVVYFDSLFCKKYDFPVLIMPPSATNVSYSFESPFLFTLNLYDSINF